MRFTISGTRHALDFETVVSAARRNVPDLIDGRHKYYVNIDGRRYPVKQLFGLATGLHWSEFITQHANRVLTRLGFKIEQFGWPEGSAVSSQTLLSPTIEVDNEGAPNGLAVREDLASVAFAVSLEPDEDGFIAASCPQLPGCHSQGRSREEAIKNIEEAIRGYIASIRHHGEEIPIIDWELVKVPV